MSNYFPSVLDNDLVGLKRSIASNSIASIGRLNHLHADVVFSSFFATSAKFLEAAVGTMFGTNIAIVVITLVKHKTIETVLVTS